MPVFLFRYISSIPVYKDEISNHHEINLITIFLKHSFEKVMNVIKKTKQDPKTHT